MESRRREGYCVQRDIMDELRLEDLAGRLGSKTPCKEKIRESLRCSIPRLKRSVLGFIPLLSWLRKYSFLEWIFGDTVSGVSVGIMHLPQGMAYALLAAVPPVFGLYSSFYPILIYFVFGTSQHISVGTYAVMSVMIGGVTERLAPDSDFMFWDNVTNSSVVDVVLRDHERVRVAAAVTFLSGIFQMLLGLVQFGFVVTYLSEPLVRGYTTAAAIHVIVSQLKYTFGIQSRRFSGPFSLLYTVIDVCYLLPETNIGTLVVSIVTVVCLVIAKEVNSLLARKLPVPVPVELLAIIIATIISWQFNLAMKYGVQVVGPIPSGLQPPELPKVSYLGSMIGDAFALSVVGYGIAISLGRIFALKYGYRVDSNQELLALGFSNTIGGLFQCFAISCSMSRTLVQESTGGKTQVAGAISAIVILVILLWIGQLFEQLPKAVLAAIIYVNLHGMMKQFSDIKMLWKSNRVDMVIWIATLILTVLFNPDMGLAASIAFSMLTVIFRTQLPQYSILGQVPGTDIYRPIDGYKQVNQVPGVVIFRSSATLYFANAEMYSDALAQKSGIDITKILSHKKKEELKKQKKEKKEAKKIAKQLTKKNTDKKTDMNDGEKKAEDTDGRCEMDPQTEEENEEQHGFTLATVEKGVTPQFGLPQRPDVIILDLTPVNFLDTVGVKTLRNIRRDYGEIGVEVLLSGCQPCVVESLEKGGFFSALVTKACLFSSIHDAVIYSQRSQGKEDIAELRPVLNGTHL